MRHTVNELPERGGEDGREMGVKGEEGTNVWWYEVNL